jgi:alpha-galactosidase
LAAFSWWRDGRPRPSGGRRTSAPYRAAGFDISVDGDPGIALGRRALPEDGLEVVALRLTSPAPAPPPRFTLKWSLPSRDIAGQWATGRQLNKTLRPDWSGGRLQASMFAREAPVSSLYGSDDRNVLTFAVSDALDTVLVGSGIREEDGRIYNEVTFFSEPHPSVSAWRAELRLDRRPVPYGTALRGVSDWWAAQPGYAPASVPEPARLPVYSTWYNYHQSVDAAVLLKEVAVAKQLGFDTIIVDDGWQTLDTGRGYAFTGDWEPERIRDMKASSTAATPWASR